MNGSFFAYMIANGDFLKIFQLIPDYGCWVDNNQGLIKAANLEFENGYVGFSTKLNDFASPYLSLGTFAKFFAYATLLSEYIVFHIFFTSKNIFLKNTIFILLVLGVFFTRFECGFLATLCLLGIAQLPESTHRFRFLYLCLFFIFICLIIISELLVFFNKTKDPLFFS